MLPATSGAITGLLTAHLSRQDGNELDIFLEEAKHKSVAVPIMPVRFTAILNVHSTSERREIEFGPVESSERPEGDAKDRCSHFVATTPWLVATSTLSVSESVSVQVPGSGLVDLQWPNFVPKTYAHHQN
jgi:hypothetical protein